MKICLCEHFSKWALYAFSLNCLSVSFECVYVHMGKRVSLNNVTQMTTLCKAISLLRYAPGSLRSKQFDSILTELKYATPLTEKNSYL